MIEELVYTAADGTPAHAILWASVQAPTKEKLREIALSLWLDMRERQAEAGFKPAAAVWIGKRRLQPTKAEIEAYKAKPLKPPEELFGRSLGSASSSDSSADSETPQDVVPPTTKTPDDGLPPDDEQAFDIDF